MPFSGSLSQYFEWNDENQIQQISDMYKFASVAVYHGEAFICRINPVNYDARIACLVQGIKVQILFFFTQPGTGKAKMSSEEKRRNRMLNCEELKGIPQEKLQGEKLISICGGNSEVSYFFAQPTNTLQFLNSFRFLSPFNSSATTCPDK